MKDKKGEYLIFLDEDGVEQKFYKSEMERFYEDKLVPAIKKWEEQEANN